MAKYQTGTDVYEIRGPGGVGTKSHIPFLGHTLVTLKDMAKFSYILYINGKRAKLSDFTEADVKKAWCV